MKTRPFMRAAALAAALLMCGCATDISGKLPPLTEPSAVSTTAPATTAKTKKTTTTTTVTTTVTTSETTTETTTAETTPEPDTVSETISVQTDSSEPMNEVYKNYTFTEEDKEFISKCVFVGDSICMGLKTYEVLPATQVLAKGNVAARSIFEYTFKLNGSEMSLLSALVDLRPEYVVFSMGMNDVNITSEQKYCENYDDLMSQVQTFLPDAKLIVLSITPITYSETGKLFTYPQNIDSFNAAIEEYLSTKENWTFCDVSHEMKNSMNMLKSLYLGSPDGVHLTRSAYDAILYQLCERFVHGKIYNAAGELVEETAETTTTAGTSSRGTSKNNDDDNITPHFVDE